MIKEAKPGQFKLAMILISIMVAVVLAIIGFMVYVSTYGNPYWVNKQKYEKRTKEIIAQSIMAQNEQKSTTQNTTNSNQSYALSEAEKQELIEDKRTAFADGIIKNMKGICREAYFDKNGAFIVVVNSEWHTFSKGEKDDIIFLIERDLRDAKKDLNVEGLGQIFSTSGKGLETFYGK